MTKPSALILFLLCLVGMSSCQRSLFRKDKEEETNRASEAPNAVPEQSIAEKIEGFAQPKKRVIVLTFWNDTPIKQNDLNVFAADELKRGLFLTRKVIVASEIKGDLNTEDFVDGDHIRVAQLIREGRRLGVSAMVVGRLTKITFRQKGDEVGLFRHKQSMAAADLEIKVFDIQGGREIVANSQTGEASASALAAFNEANLDSSAYRLELTRAALRDAVAKFVPEVIRSIDKLAWQGQIAKTIGPKIYINAGRASGLIAGDILRVMNPGDEIYDPQSGALLGRAQGQLKGTLEVVDFIGTDAAVAQVHTGSNFREGDFVQLY